MIKLKHICEIYFSKLPRVIILAIIITGLAINFLQLIAKFCYNICQVKLT